MSPEFFVRVPTFTLVVAATATLTLASCSDATDPVAGGGGASAGSQDPSSTRTPTITSPSASPTNGPSSSPGAQAEANCPDGRWKLDNDEWTSLVQAQIPAGSTVESVDGDVILTLGADGSYSTAYQDWTITMTVEGGTAVINRNGTDSGTWEDTDGRAVLTDQNPNSVVNGYVETSEGRVEMSNTDTVPTGLGASFAYECQGTTMLATTGDGILTFTRTS